MAKKLGPRLTIEMSRAQALALNIIHCECGHPPNNHFDHDARPCAHCDCTELRERVSVGKLVDGER